MLPIPTSLRIDSAHLFFQWAIKDHSPETWKEMDSFINSSPHSQFIHKHPHCCSRCLDKWATPGLFLRKMSTSIGSFNPLRSTKVWVCKRKSKWQLYEEVGRNIWNEWLTGNWDSYHSTSGSTSYSKKPIMVWFLCGTLNSAWSLAATRGGATTFKQYLILTSTITFWGREKVYTTLQTLKGLFIRRTNHQKFMWLHQLTSLGGWT